MQNLFIYITFPTLAEARLMGSRLLESRIAACINILTGMESMYWWEGNIEKSDEIVMIAKTTANNLTELTDFVKTHHSYSCPCIAAIPVSPGNTDYFQWLAENLKKKQ
jgi:periplasmic divalent cation tolerance protein